MEIGEQGPAFTTEPAQDPFRRDEPAPAREPVEVETTEREEEEVYATSSVAFPC